MRQLLTGARLFTGDVLLDDHALLLAGAEILDIVPAVASVAGAARVPLPEGSLLAPGFIDTQVNGGGGVLFNDTPTAAGALAIAAAHRRFGTTALLPTVITDDLNTMMAAAEAAAEAAAIPGGGIIGVHLEGPFLNPERRGVHKAAHIRRPNGVDLDRLSALPRHFGDLGRVLLTLAPEQVDDGDIARLVRAGIVLAGGHSAASHERTQAALRAGLRGFTHLFNAMPPISNRTPGIALAAMTAKDAWCGLIVDGVHVHPDLLALALAAKPRGKMMLVTDAMPPTGTDATTFTLYGERIHRRDGRLVTDDGVLAGADIDMAQAVRNAMRLLDVELEEALRMASLYPARFLGMDGRLGQLAAGFQADLVLLDAQQRVLGTWVAGQRDGPTGPA
ncbi:N-acetylglucosamine-6-phosphate deacetylase [Nitrospirillum viridazoti]|uniref:N-acetylglucosamine-6-phosphate deacetylase n=1 Tax=Nitrospirillum viridazoti CBAmc TaxID=1441467 RepID=A0A248K327_9PROT|nr:N-acetylglucosamine-6-phosphate deacetylase [Nitrospirillum amazonense]ASG25199.1 N-acetylglucosamine-6-phosphate deacetylase [Nitrospirillum amazonense CBAmc]TWB29215.1 N-acetylglucosamine 6-phosphate deacetylase [Nitrospirillum amazonense]